jgi:hypothetical protein
LKGIKRDIPIILYSGVMPENLQHVDVLIDKDESTANRPRSRPAILFLNRIAQVSAFFAKSIYRDFGRDKDCGLS